jgi:hypothetical protein
LILIDIDFRVDEYILFRFLLWVLAVLVLVLGLRFLDGTRFGIAV